MGKKAKLATVSSSTARKGALPRLLLSGEEPQPKRRFGGAAASSGKGDGKMAPFQGGNGAVVKRKAISRGTAAPTMSFWWRCGHRRCRCVGLHLPGARSTGSKWRSAAPAHDRRVSESSSPPSQQVSDQPDTDKAINAKPAQQRRSLRSRIWLVFASVRYVAR